MRQELYERLIMSWGRGIYAVQFVEALTAYLQGLGISFPYDIRETEGQCFEILITDSPSASPWRCTVTGVWDWGTSDNTPIPIFRTFIEAKFPAYRRGRDFSYVEYVLVTQAIDKFAASWAIELARRECAD